MNNSARVVVCSFARRYGKGDALTVRLDVDERTVEFLKNGEALRER